MPLKIFKTRVRLFSGFCFCSAVICLLLSQGVSNSNINCARFSHFAFSFDRQIVIVGGVGDEPNRTQEPILDFEHLSEYFHFNTRRSLNIEGEPTIEAFKMESRKWMVLGSLDCENCIMDSIQRIVFIQSGWVGSFNINTSSIAGTHLLHSHADGALCKLSDDTVLVAGGTEDGGSGAISNCEIYDPAANHCIPTGSMEVPRKRVGLSLILLQSGCVLAVGGNDHLPCSCELYDPKIGGWRRTGKLLESHDYSASILLLSGEVLVAGGKSSDCEIYNPATELWRKSGSLHIARYNSALVTLPDGGALITGGFHDGDVLNSCERFNCETGKWIATGNLLQARACHTANVINGSQVLVVGGANKNNIAIPTCEIYDTKLGRWTTP